MFTLSMTDTFSLGLSRGFYRLPENHLIIHLDLYMSMLPQRDKKMMNILFIVI